MRGWNCSEAPYHADRLMHPMVRKRDLLAPVSPEAAVKEIAQRLGAAKPAGGAPAGAAILFAVGPSVANEDACAVGSLARHLGATVCATDLSGARTARVALGRVLGRGTPPGSLDALAGADRVWVFGADLENFPQICSRVTRAARRGAELVFFDILPAQPGSGHRSQVLIPPAEIAALPLLLQKAALDLDRVSPGVKAAPGFEELASVWRPGGAPSPPAHPWLPEERAKEMAKALSESESPAVVIGERWLSSAGNPGLTVQLLQALALLGAEDKILMAAGECNSWGVLDSLPGGQAAPSPIEALMGPDGAQALSALVVVGDDLVRRAPQPGHLAKNLAGIGTVIVLDRFAGETLRFAHAVLPTCCFGELDGTLTSSLGTVQRWRQAVKPPGECSPEAAWVTRIGRRLGLEEWPVTRKQWFEALRKENPLYAGPQFDALYGEDGSPGVPLGEATRLGFCAPSPVPPARPAEGFPMAVAFAAHPAGWSTGALSLREELLRRECPESTLAVNPEDLKAAGLKPGWPARVATPFGEAVFAAQEDNRLPPGVMAVVPVPGTPAAALRGLLHADDGAAPAAQPVPARLERPSP